jgi:hypothetical protein
MKIQWADQGAGSSRESLDWRIERHNLLIGSIRDDADRVHAAGKIALEYVWLTNNQTYNLGYPKGYDLTSASTRFEIAQHISDVVAVKRLDGIFLDCPLDYHDLRAALDTVAAVKDALGGLIVMPNFGSYDVWELTSKVPKWQAWAELQKLTDWHFVEVALHTRDRWADRYQRSVEMAMQRLEAGKHVVLGIDDTTSTGQGPHDPHLAAAIAGHLPRHPNLYVAYRSAVVMPHGSHPADYKWNETLEALR